MLSLNEVNLLPRGVEKLCSKSESSQRSPTIRHKAQTLYAVVFAPQLSRQCKRTVMVCLRRPSVNVARVDQIAESRCIIPIYTCGYIPYYPYGPAHVSGCKPYNVHDLPHDILFRFVVYTFCTTYQSGRLGYRRMRSIL